MRVAVLGRLGQLGAAVVAECAQHHDVVSYDRLALDVTDADAVARAMAASRAEAIVNCAAYNGVDAAEDHPLEALQVNGLAVRSLARAAKTLGCILVHYSSDFVFDGTSATPYTETDHPNPQSVYAMSKLLGEWFASDVPRAYVLRVESLFGSVLPGPHRGSLAGIVSALRSGATARVIADRTVSPTYIVDAARATRELLEGHAAPGLYHCVNSGHSTWLEVAQEASRLLGLEPRFETVTLDGMKLKAARPRYCALSNAKLADAGVRMPPWQDALRRYLAATVAGS